MGEKSDAAKGDAAQGPFVFPDWFSRTLAVPYVILGAAVIVVCLVTHLLLGGVPYGQVGSFKKVGIWILWGALFVVSGIVKAVWLARAANKADLPFVELVGKLVNLQYVRVVSPLLALVVVMVYVLLSLGAARYLPGVLVMVSGVMALELRQAWVWPELDGIGAWLVLTGAIMAVFLSGHLLLAVGAFLGGGTLLWGFYLLGRYGRSEKTE